MLELYFLAKKVTTNIYIEVVMLKKCFIVAKIMNIFLIICIRLVFVAAKSTSHIKNILFEKFSVCYVHLQTFIL